MAKKYKILVPKPAIADENSADMVLHKADDIVVSKGKWQEEIMDTFVENGWAIEVKVDSVEESIEVAAEVKPKRARNKKGELKADDPSTPDVNEAWEGGEAPKKTTKKKTTKKKA
jgi:hypothetical protein